MKAHRVGLSGPLPVPESTVQIVAAGQVGKARRTSLMQTAPGESTVHQAVAAWLLTKEPSDANPFPLMLTGWRFWR